ncbi:unnamed protein product [Colias eurytheme]|nr:unnamed protein product [Colias eurytheme]
MVTNNHTADSIGNCLRFFNGIWTEGNVKWPPFKDVTTDWSWASINAFLREFNNLSVRDYLNEVHQAIISNETPKHLPVHVCYPHFMKMLSRQLQKRQIEKTLRAFILEIMAKLVHIEDYTILKKCLQSIFVIFLYPKENQELLDSLQFLSNLPDATEILGYDDDDEEDPEDILDCELDDVSNQDNDLEPEKIQKLDQNIKPVYKASPFYLDGLLVKNEIYKKSELLIKENKLKNNAYFCKTFIEYAMMRIIPFIPLWSLSAPKDKKHSSNASVENHFKNVKIEKKIAVKAGHFIDKQWQAISTRYKQLDLPIPKVYTLRKRRVVNEPDNMQSEEAWNRDKTKKASRISYLEGKRLKQDTAKSKAPALIFDNKGTIKNNDYYYCPNCPR